MKRTTARALRNLADRLDPKPPPRIVVQTPDLDSAHKIHMALLKVRRATGR